jgi:hypothetical protein
MSQAQQPLSTQQQHPAGLLHVAASLQRPPELKMNLPLPARRCRLYSVEYRSTQQFSQGRQALDLHNIEVVDRTSDAEEGILFNGANMHCGGAGSSDLCG